MNGGDDDNGNEGDGGDGGDDDNGRAAAGEAKLLLDGQELATAAPEHLRMMGLLLDQHLNIWTYGEHLRTMGEADTG